MVAAQTIVIGAGPAGLGVAAELIGRGLPCTVLDSRDVVGSSWADRYDGLHLHTARWLSGSPGIRIPPSVGPWVSRDDYHHYLRYYARRRDVRVDFGITAERVDRVDGRWRVDTSAGSMACDHLVVATGLCRRPATPRWPGLAGFTGTLLHSAAYRAPGPFRGRQVLVVGAGNSGTEIAVELLDVGARVSVSVRTPPGIVRRSTLGVSSQAIGLAVHPLPEAVLNPVMGMFRRVSVPDMSGYGLPAPEAPYSQFLRTGTIPVLDYGFVSAVRGRRIQGVPAVEGFDGDRVLLADDRTCVPDAVICATGYRAGLESLVGHLGVLDGRGMPPAAGDRTMPQPHGLHFVGITLTLTGLLHEIAGQARHVAAAIAAGPVGVR